MTMRSDKLSETVLSVLEKHSPVVEPVGRRRWDFALANGKAVGFTAAIDDEWVVMRAEADDIAEATETTGWWELLCLNTRLDAGTKFVLPAGSDVVGLQAEIPVDDDSDMRQRLHETCEAFESALAWLHAGGGTQSTEMSTPESARESRTSSTPDPSGSEFDLKNLCEATGWPLNQREDGSVVFELQARSGFQQAIVRPRSQERVSVSVDLAERSVLSVVSRQAISLMLLRASKLVRGARAASDVRDNGAVIRFETVFPSRPSAKELEHALAALTVANDLCGKETVALQDEGIAEQYLRLQGWAETLSESVSEPRIELREATVAA